jgi:peptide/nickel transport system ATP-binding protein
MSETILEVQNLHTHFFTREGVVKAVDGVDFSLKKGEILGLVGESGSGKSMTGFSILGLLDVPGKIVKGKILYQGVDLVQLNQEELRKYRGDRIAMVFQDIMMTLNPLLRIDVQMIEAIQAHKKIGKREAYEMARCALGDVGIAAPDERLRAYPHQLSGGMRQRVAIAIAILNKVDIIIADEPTTALDVTIQSQILHKMQELCRDSNLSVIWITHDLTVVAGLADRINVMYAGKLVESGTTDEVLDSPLHPYTRGLIGSVPSRNKKIERLYQIPGMPPDMLNLPPGCAFAARCSKADDKCRENPVANYLTSERMVRCFHPFSGNDK